jgi:predicted small metal-binding protein
MDINSTKITIEILSQEEFDIIVNMIGLKRMFDCGSTSCGIFNRFASKYAEEITEILMEHLSKTHGQRRIVLKMLTESNLILSEEQLRLIFGDSFEDYDVLADSHHLIQYFIANNLAVYPFYQNWFDSNKIGLIRTKGYY